MSAHVEAPGEEETQEPTLLGDQRWLLVQRILAGDRFVRAAQLRKILLYVSKAAILRPGETVSEYDIAREVLGRREDFDPADDNIVRAQFTHLRRKLESYFSEEGRAEVLVLSIPRGSYIPIFSPVPVSPMVDALATVAEPAPEQPAEAPYLRPSRWRRWVWPAAVCAALGSLMVLAIAYSHRPSQASPQQEKPPFTNAFLRFLARSEGGITVVLPDTSEMMIQLITGKEVSAADYSAPDFPQRQIAAVKDPEVRYILTQLAMRRNTTATEAKIAFDMVAGINRMGAHGAVRYARDLHVRDFNEGNTVLIGTQRSDPWVSLFTGRTNFQFVSDKAANNFHFLNADPQPGEQPQYDVPASHEKTRNSFVDIALIENPSRSGFVLLILGTDAEANEAAVNFILHGHLGPEIDALLARKDLNYFEIFLRGQHIVGESQDSLQLVALRPR